VNVTLLSYRLAVGDVSKSAIMSRSPTPKPWRFRIDGNTLHLYADTTRRLPATDPTAATS
jgi:hypothetical protein